MRRMLATLLAALLLVTAGCLGGPVTDEDTTTTAEPTETATPTGTTTATPTPTETTEPTPTETTTDGPLAPGVSRDGSVNSSRLLDAHAAALVDAGAAVETNYTAGADRQFDRRTAFAAGLDRVSTDAVRRTGDAVYGLSQWVNETVFITRTADGDRVLYRGSERFPDRHYRRTAIDRGRLAEIIAGSTFAVEDVSRSDGTRRTTLVSTAFDGDEYGNLSVELVVTGDGVVESLSATGELDDGTDIEYSYDVIRLGVESVERPDWVADAPPVVDARLSFEFVNCTGTYLRLVHEEGDPIPAGSTVEITVNETSYATTLDSRLPRGGSRYLYLTGDGLQAAETEPSPGDVVGIGNEVETRVVTGGGLLVTQGAMGFNCERAGEGSGRSGSTSDDA